jgi:hypothetical protein
MGGVSLADRSGDTLESQASSLFVWVSLANAFWAAVLRTGSVSLQDEAGVIS